MSDTSDDMEAWASYYENQFINKKKRRKMYTLKGILKVIGSTVQVSDSFKKREFVVTDDSGQYAQDIQLQSVQDRCEVLDKFKVGERVEVTFFLRGREWTSPKDGSVKYFNSLEAWKVDYSGEHAEAIQSEKHNRDIMANDLIDDASDDLPF